VVVDGGSTDGTLELLRAAPGVRFTSEPDRGMYDAINRGLALATGDIVAYQNADDRYAGPHVISRAVQALAERPAVDVVYGDFLYVDEQGRPLRRQRGPDFDLRRLRRCNVVPPHSAFVRRRVVHEHGFWLDPGLRFAGDWDWFLRMALAGRRFHHVAEVWSAFRRRPDSLTATLGWRAKLREWRLICRRNGCSLPALVAHEALLAPLQARWRSRRETAGASARRPDQGA
jgi:glycosyltransferase involved in cell wall biosynthesis